MYLVIQYLYRLGLISVLLGKAIAKAKVIQTPHVNY